MENVYITIPTPVVVVLLLCLTLIYIVKRNT